MFIILAEIVTLIKGKRKKIIQESIGNYLSDTWFLVQGTDLVRCRIPIRVKRIP